MLVATLTIYRVSETVKASATGENDQLSIQQTGIVNCAAALLTAAWYPGAQTANPATYCYLRSVRDTTLALLDGNTGKASSLASFCALGVLTKYAIPAEKSIVSHHRPY